MPIRLVYHDPNAGTGAVSPFDTSLVSVLSGGIADIACPYLGLSFLTARLREVHRWRLLTDVEAWMGIIPARHAREALVRWCRDHAGRVRHLSGLHAKVVIGRDLALIGSANLTDSGICRRTEMGALLEDAEQLSELRLWFETCWAAAADPPVEELAWLVDHGPIPQLSVAFPPERPASLGTSPVRAIPMVPGPPSGGSGGVATVEDVGDDADGVGAVATVLRQRVSRLWAETYFNWVAELISLTGLPEGDRQLTLTLTDEGRSLGVNVNNRSALSWQRGGWRHEPLIYYLLPQTYAELLRDEASGRVAKFHQLGEANEPDPPCLLVTSFPPPREVADASTFKSKWREAVSREVRRRRGHSPRGQGRHLPLLYRMAVDRHVRSAVFDVAYSQANGGGHP